MAMWPVTPCSGNRGTASPPAAPSPTCTASASASREPGILSPDPSLATEEISRQTSDRFVFVLESQPDVVQARGIAELTEEL